MSCLLSNGIVRSCGFQFGGLKKVYLANFEEVTALGYSGTTCQTITGVTMATGATAQWYEFEYEPSTAQKLEELVAGAVSRFVNQTLNLRLANITQAKKCVLDELANATLSIIVQDMQGIYWFLGEPTKSAGLRVSVLTVDSGLAQTDDASASITMIGGNLGYANQITASAVAAAIA